MKNIVAGALGLWNFFGACYVIAPPALPHPVAVQVGLALFVVLVNVMVVDRVWGRE